MSVKPLAWLFRLITLGLIGVLMFLSVSMRTGGLGPRDFIDVAPTLAPQSWQQAHPDSWINLSNRALKEGELEQAERLALKALNSNLTHGRAYAQLLSIYDQQDAHAQAETVTNLAANLWPAQSYAHARVADYWLRQGNLEKVLPEWNVLLIREPETRQKLFPVLHNIANQPGGLAVLKPYTDHPPPWWDSFFSFASRQKDNLDIMEGLYQSRVDSEIPLSDRERRLFVRRLLQAKRWNEAYFAWLGGLEPEQLALSGQIYDGGFEGDSFNTGYDWQIGKPKGVKINTTTTTGIKGRRALRITFNTRRLNFRHVSQRLQLTEGGDYTFSFRYRVARLRTNEGLSWRIHCQGNTQKQPVLMETPALKGRTPWQESRINFSVPAEDCPSQLLRLEAASRYSHNHEFKGTIWFDDLEILRRTEPTPEPGDTNS